MITNTINTALNALSSFENKLFESAKNISEFSSINHVQENIAPANVTSEPSTTVKDFKLPYFVSKPDTDFTSNIINMKIAEHGYKANLNVLKTAEDMTKSVINIFS